MSAIIRAHESKLLAFKVSNELEHAYSHSGHVTITIKSTSKQLQRNERESGAPCSWWVRKQLAAFSTTKETVVDCRFAVAVPPSMIAISY